MWTLRKEIGINHTKAEYSIKAVVDKYIECVDDIGLWESERIIFSKYINKNSRILDVGCGTGRTTIPMYQSGYKHIIGLDLSDVMVSAAKDIAESKGLDIAFIAGNACALPFEENSFEAVIFSFNGLMTIPTIEMRQQAINEIYRILKTGGLFIFTTHYMDNPQFASYWAEEKDKWSKGVQDSRLMEYGDLIFSKPDAYEDALNFVHVPVNGEVEGCISKSGFEMVYNEIRCNICEENESVMDFSVDSKFWVCRK